MFLRCLPALFCFCFSVVAFAQSISPAERIISVDVYQATAEQFLRAIDRQAQTHFSYNPKILADVPPFSLSLRQVSVREALHHAFGEAIRLKVKGNYIILQRTAAPLRTQQAESRPAKVWFSGYITDKNTQKRLENVSVYEKNTLAAALTNAYGFFQIQVETQQNEVELFFAKAHYVPQKLVLPAQNSPFANLMLEPIPQLETLPTQEIHAIGDTSRSFKFFVPAQQEIHRQNLKENFWRKAQISLLPMLGTNHLLSGLVRNSLSINIMLGYNAGVKRLEVGGIGNINAGKVEGTQLAGVFNAVKGQFRGAQIGGITNFVTDSARGVQVSGIINANLQTMRGAQIAGVVNANRKGIKGAQIAGTLNIAGSLDGAQVAGNVNICLKEMRGVQVSGALNVTLGRMEGVQVAVANVAGKSHQGWQIGIFNYADSSHSLKQVGLINFVRRGGFKNIELATDEQLFTNFTLRSGTPYFYTLARIGIKYYPNRPFWHYGYGVGLRIARWRTWESNTEWIAYQLLRSLGRAYELEVFENFGLRYQLFLTKYIGKHFSITLGGALDGASLSLDGADYQEARTISPAVFYNKTEFGRDWRLSGGGTLGVRYNW